MMTIPFLIKSSHVPFPVPSGVAQDPHGPAQHLRNHGQRGRDPGDPDVRGSRGRLGGGGRGAGQGLGRPAEGPGGDAGPQARGPGGEGAD